MSKPRFTTQQMAAAGIIAAIYAALTLLLPIPPVKKAEGTPKFFAASLFPFLKACDIILFRQVPSPCPSVRHWAFVRRSSSIAVL